VSVHRSKWPQFLVTLFLVSMVGCSTVKPPAVSPDWTPIDHNQAPFEPEPSPWEGLDHDAG